MAFSLFFSLPQSYIHGSSQAQFVAESHIILLLSILSPMCNKDACGESLCLCEVPVDINCDTALQKKRKLSSKLTLIEMPNSTY